MLARTSVLKHPMDIELKTPLLVPSFSSKGFGFNKNGKSEIKQLVKFASAYLDSTMLVSAYDIYYGHIHRPKSLFKITDLIFLDSGGYETTQDHDLSTIKKRKWQFDEWKLNLYKEVLSSWPEYIPTVFVSYDHGSKRRHLDKQILSAKRFFEGYPNQLSDFLVKPNIRTQQYVDIIEVLEHIDDYKNFDIIGFTEKEIAPSPLKRMVFIARVRKALDAAGISIPIHIFGSLDPLSSWLYFLAGAEIFDGLTWARYAYYKGICLYYQNYGVLEVELNRSEDFSRSMAAARNLVYLDKLQSRMRAFAMDHEFDKIDFHSKILVESYDRLRGEMGGEL